MALIKSVMTPMGVPAEYWIIDSTQDYFRDRLADVTLFGFFNEAAYASNPGVQPLMTRVVRVDMDPVLLAPTIDLRQPHYQALEAFFEANPDDPLNGATNDGKVP